MCPRHYQQLEEYYWKCSTNRDSLFC